MQVITVDGRIGKSAETRQAGSGEVTTFNLAVDQGFGERKQTNWYRIQIWGKRGSSVARFMEKGGSVTVSGELEIGSYNGEPQYTINANAWTLPNNKPSNSGSASQTRSSSRDIRDELDDELPPF